MRSGRAPSLALLAAACVAVAGCMPPAAAPPAPPTGPGPAAAPPVGPAATPAPVRAASVLEGKLDYFGQPLADAEVTVRLLGKEPVLATARSGPDGKFALILPTGSAGAALGAVVQLTAVSGAKKLTNITEVPAPRKLQQAPAEGGLVLDPASTMAVIILAPRLIAAIELGTPEAIQAALTSVSAVAEAMGGDAAGLLDPAKFEETVTAVLDLAGTVVQTPELRDLLADAVPAAALDVAAAQATTLADTIREAVAAGLPLPDVDLLGPLPVGDASAAPIFTAEELADLAPPPADGPGPDPGSGPAGGPTGGEPAAGTAGGPSGGTGGDTSGGASEDLEDVGITINRPADGPYTNPTGPVMGTVGLQVRLSLARTLLATSRRWLAADVNKFRLKLEVLDGATYVDAGASVDVPWKGVTGPIVGRLGDLAAGRAYRVAVEAWGDPGGATAGTRLNAQAPCHVPFDLRSLPQDASSVLTGDALVQLDGAAFSGKAVVTPTDLPAGTAGLVGELWLDGGAAPLSSHAVAQLGGAFTFAGLSAGPSYVFKVVAKDAGGATLATRSSAVVRFDPAGQDVEQDVALTLSFTP